MRTYFRIIIRLLIIWFGFKALRQAYGPIEAGLLTEFQYLPFIFLVISTILAIVVDIKYFELNKKIYQFCLSLIGVTLCTVVVLKFTRNNSIDNSKTVLRVSHLPRATNLLSFPFKDNGKFRLTGYDRLGQTIYYGNYSRRQDTINILSSNYNGDILLPLIGLIQRDTLYWRDFDVMLIKKKAPYNIVFFVVRQTSLI